MRQKTRSFLAPVGVALLLGEYYTTRREVRASGRKATFSASTVSLRSFQHGHRNQQLNATWPD
jgi:hypothetical protein